ncbi:hypothetical protein H671_4g13401 [Cricetulus griseus]|uniref:Uncharacterized protein n=1 Tax=Cricetulus griseus TaxID=10029 RepID=A0A061I722_CRIGR|nr:hypothetical protein H671_4g13401 [Cricetulus griseus]
MRAASECAVLHRTLKSGAKHTPKAGFVCFVSSPTGIKIAQRDIGVSTCGLLKQMNPQSDGNVPRNVFPREGKEGELVCGKRFFTAVPACQTVF